MLFQNFFKILLWQNLLANKVTAMGCLLPSPQIHYFVISLRFEILKNFNSTYPKSNKKYGYDEYDSGRVLIPKPTDFDK